MAYNRYNEKPKKIIATFVCALICLSMMAAACALIFSSCGAGTDVDSFYIQLRDGGEKLYAAIPVDDSVDSDNVYLFGIGIWNTAIPEGAEPLAKAKISGGVAKAEIDVNGQLAETVCKGYLFASKTSEGKYIPVTGVYYVTNPYEGANDGGSDEDGVSAPLKGAIGSAPELLSLSVGSTVVTVELGDLIEEKYSDNVISYVWDGQTYYANADRVNALDKTIRSYSQAGIYVYLEIVQTKSASELSGRVKNIVFGGVSDKKGYAFNMTTREGASYICGMLDFLASRYGNGGENGKASAFIIGRNVNDMGNSYAGGPSEEAGILNYSKAVRAAYNILLSHTSEGNVYVALDNRWGVADNKSFTARDMLSAFNNLVSAEGDFYWQVSVEANSSDRSNSAIWNDPLAVGRADFISPVNGDVLGNQLYSEVYKCNGTVRRILFNRFTVGGVNEDARAASYAYAYYKSLSFGNVDGLIYGTLTDGAVAGEGLMTGDVPPKEKKIASVLRSIDDEGGDLDFVSELVGSEWDLLYKKYAKDAKIRSTYRCDGGDVHSNKNVKIITDFSGGDTFGFLGGYGVEYTELRYSAEWGRPVLYAKLGGELDYEKTSLISPAVSTSILEDSGYLGITALVGSKDKEATVTVRLSGFDRNGEEHVLVALATVKTGEWTEFYCDVSDFIEEIDSESVRIAIFTESADEIYLARLIGEAPEEGGFPAWATILIIVVAAGGGLAAFVVWFRKNYTFVRE